MAGFHSAPSRIRALERLLEPSGVFVVVDLPSTTDAERAEAAKRRADAERQGRGVVMVTISFYRAPEPPTTAAVPCAGAPAATPSGYEP